MANLRPLNSIAARLMAVFATAKSSDLADLQADLESVDVASDIWNGTPPPPAVGINLAMHGDGATPMTREYSTPATQTTAGGAFADLGDRLCSLESAVKGMLAHMFKADLTDDQDRFPNSETTKTKICEIKTMNIRTTAEAIAESERELESLGFTADELREALDTLRGKSLPMQAASISVRVSRLEKALSKLKQDLST